MNIEKAIEYFKQRIEHIEEYLGTYGDVYGDYDLTAEEEKALEALGNEKLVNYKAAISALEKQVAKKPDKSNLYYICPSCRKFIEKFEHYHGQNKIQHCKWCGQKLDWSGGNE